MLPLAANLLGAFSWWRKEGRWHSSGWSRRWSATANRVAIERATFFHHLRRVCSIGTRLRGACSFDCYHLCPPPTWWRSFHALSLSTLVNGRKGQGRGFLKTTTPTTTGTPAVVAIPDSLCDGLHSNCVSYWPRGSVDGKDAYVEFPSKWNFSDSSIFAQSFAPKNTSIRIIVWVKFSLGIQSLSLKVNEMSTMVTIVMDLLITVS